MDPAHVDPLHLVATGAERRDGVDVAREQDPHARVGLPLVKSPRRLGAGREHDLDVRRHAHAIEILLPRTRAHRVVHQHDEPGPERLAPPHDHLAVNQAIVDAVQRDAHAAGVRIALLPASAARRAASAGVTSRWNTKSSSIARFTPVTTATSPWPRASRTELVRQEPPGRSTKITAGPFPTAAVSRADSAPESQPSLLTGTSALRTPAIAATADTSASATAACDTITPRSGSLIIFLEIRLQLPLLGHAPDQAVVERLRRVYAAVAQQVRHRHDLADHRQVLARVERHRHERQPHLQDLRLLAFDAGAVVLAPRVPVLELDHHLDTLLLAHRADAEQRLDVDQPDAADLHEVVRQLVPAADQDVVAAPRDVHDVVGDEAMPALDQVQHALALADPRAPEEQEPHAEHVGERAVDRGARGEGVVQERLEPPVELRRLELGADHRHALGPPQLDQLGRRLLPLRDHDARDVEREQRLERLAALGWRQRRQVRDLRLAQDVDPVGREAPGVSREHQPRARRPGRGDHAIEPRVARQRLELERIAPALKQVPDANRG